MLEIKYEKSFKKDLKRITKRGLGLKPLEKAVNLLANGQPLPPKYHDHPLSGKYKNFRDCHIQPDWVLVYKIDKDELVLVLIRTGTHSDLF